MRSNTGPTAQLTLRFLDDSPSAGEKAAIIGGSNFALRALDAAVAIAEQVYTMFRSELKAAPVARTQRQLEAWGGFHGHLRGGG